VQSKADVSQLNLPHGTNNKKVDKQKKKLKSKNGYAQRYLSSPRNLWSLWSQSGRRKRRLRWKGFAEKKGFKPGLKE